MTGSPLTEAVVPPIADAQQIDEYRLIRPLGPADGTTFLAHDRLLDRAVVLSFFASSTGAPDPRLAGARALARVTHPNLCPLHRVRDAGARPYVVSAYARGRRLDAIVNPLPDRGVLDVGRALARGLATLHLAGVTHGDVRRERVVVSDEGIPQLFGFACARAGTDDTSQREDVKALVALLEPLAGEALRAKLRALVDRPAGAPNADELSAALQALANPALAAAALVDNPYRGLRPFESEHATMFFGRQRETAELLARLRGQPLLLVAGRSGAGKSSLVRAGLAPAIGAGALGERSVWDVVTMTPGTRPIEELTGKLGPIFGEDAGKLSAALRQNPGLAGRMARGRTDRGLLLIVNQLEELLTLADGAEREAFGEVVGRLGALAPGVRVVMTTRSDFLARLGELGLLGRNLLRATYILPPMRRDGMREAVEGPARACGFTFETAAMVDALLDEMAARTEALPLLSFALAELWLARDEARRVLPAAALERLGGAAAALARHGDILLATLRPDERGEARRLLLTLVTADETRARPTEDALVGAAGQKARVALAALVRGRLVVAGETTYEIAHEALVRVWPRLRTWLDEASEARAAAARLALAAREWVRLGRGVDGLAGERLLRDLETPGALEGASDDARTFVAASGAAARRARVRRLALRFGAPVGAVFVLAAAVGGVRWGERRQSRAFVAARLAEADSSRRDARALDVQVEAARADAFARCDAGDSAKGESRWRDAIALARREANSLAEASASVGLALARSPLNPLARARAADLAYAWLLAAERDRDADVSRELLARLSQLDDDGSRRVQLGRPAHLRVSTSPAGASVVLRPVRLDADGHRVETEPRAVTPGAPLEIEPGSYVLEARAEGRYSTRDPILLGRGADEHIDVPLPSLASIPPSFVYVPGGTSLVGAADVEGVRSTLVAEPQHSVYVNAFLIAQNEVTYGEYLEFLASLPPSESLARRPFARHISLAYDGQGVPSLTLDSTTARRGEPLCRAKRVARRCQDWGRLAVAGITWEDAKRFTAWLASGAVPGARLCTEREWERAARGADGRLYAGGDVLHPGDANFDETYATDLAQMGDDEVGSFPGDVSPFGVHDLDGNLAEWVTRDESKKSAARGGYSQNTAFNARVEYRHLRYTGRYHMVGLRVCADAPPSR